MARSNPRALRIDRRPIGAQHSGPWIFLRPYFFRLSLLRDPRKRPRDRPWAFSKLPPFRTGRPKEMIFLPFSFESKLSNGVIAAHYSCTTDCPAHLTVNSIVDDAYVDATWIHLCGTRGHNDPRREEGKNVQRNKRYWHPMIATITSLLHNSNLIFSVTVNAAARFSIVLITSFIAANRRRVSRLVLSALSVAEILKSKLATSIHSFDKYFPRIKHEIPP